MPQQTLRAHSLVEAYLYLKVTPCSICKHGATEASAPVLAPDTPKHDPGAGSEPVRIITTCKNCGGSQEHFFDVPTGAGEPEGDAWSSGEPAPINPSEQPSTIIDVAQWLTLYHLKLEQAGRETDKICARRLSHQAAQCLGEALRFYEADSDLPLPEAFFTDRSREAFRDHPQRFARQRLVDLAGKLPKFDALSLAAARKRPWWKLW